MQDLATQLMYTTVPIWVDRGGTDGETATAFLVMVPTEPDGKQSIPFAVTARHVTEGAKRVVVEFSEADADQPSQRRIRAAIPSEAALQHVSRELDLVALPVAPILNHLEASGRRIFLRSIAPDLLPSDRVLATFSAAEELLFVGYAAGIYEAGPLLPIMRRGITATPLWSEFENKPAFLVDATVYPGFSGSPIFAYSRGYYPSETRAYFVGMLSAAVSASSPGAEPWAVGLGQAIKGANVWSFLRSIVSQLLYTPRGA